MSAKTVIKYVVLIIIVAVSIVNLSSIISLLMMVLLPAFDVYSDYWVFGKNAILALFGGLVIGIISKKKAILISLITVVVTTIVFFRPVLDQVQYGYSISYDNFRALGMFILCILPPMLIGCLYGFFKR